MSEKLLHLLTRLHTLQSVSTEANRCSLNITSLNGVIPKGSQCLGPTQSTAPAPASLPDSVAGFDACLTLHLLPLVSTEMNHAVPMAVLTGAFLTNSELNLITSLLPKLD